jgi:hypothetical protein
MSDISLPPLPESKYVLAREAEMYCEAYTTSFAGYDDDQMRDYARAAVIADRAARAPQQAAPPDDGVRRAAADVIAVWDAHGTPISLRGWIDILRQRLAERPAPAAPQQAEPVAWIACSERMPKSGVTVLACYANSHGRSRRIRAKWLADRTHEGSPETDDLELVYDEATDMCYWPEGWYEQIDNWRVTWPEHSAVAVVEGEPTHWMPLPAPPGKEGA